MKASFIQKRIKILKKFIKKDKNIKFLIARLIIKQKSLMVVMKRIIIIKQIYLRIRKYKKIYKVDCNQHKTKTIKFLIKKFLM